MLILVANISRLLFRNTVMVIKREISKHLSRILFVIHNPWYKLNYEREPTKFRIFLCLFCCRIFMDFR